jgi:HK97 family phage major capsid protein
MNKKEKLAALEKEAKEFALKADTSKKEDVEKLSGYKASIEALKAEIKADEEKAALLTMIGTKEPEDKETPEAKKAKSLGENFVNFARSTQRGKRFNLIAPAFEKAASDTQTSPAAAVDWATTFDRNVVTAPRIGLVVRDLFGAETISGSTLQYLVEGAIQGAPAVTAEGAEKPQVHFADPTPVTVALKKIACHIKESDEYIDDYPFLASAINGRLLYELGLVEQNTLVTDLLGTTGIQTGNIAANATVVQIADEILKAAMDVQDGSGFAADAVVINPADWYTLRIGRDSNQRYYGEGYFGSQAIPNLWGIPVCVTTAVAAGTIVVGAFKTCGSVVSKGGVSVEATNSNEDDFVKNLMTIRAEERLALAVRRPAGFKKLTKATA